MMAEESKLYTRQETAKYLNVSIRTVDRLIKTGELEVNRIGLRNVRISEHAIKEYLNQTTIKGEN